MRGISVEKLNILIPFLSYSLKFIESGIKVESSKFSRLSPFTRRGLQELIDRYIYIDMRCVECGEEVEQLYREYSKGNIRLTICSSCNHIADKYVEYEVVLILIDLMLHKPQAYRHILDNREPPISPSQLWKMYMILTLLDMNVKAYLMEERHCIYSDMIRGPKSDFSPYHLSQLTCHFFFLSGLENIVSTVILCVLVRWGWPKAYQQRGPVKLVGAIFISSFAKMFIWMTVIWQYHWSIIHVIGIQVVLSNHLALQHYLGGDWSGVKVGVLLTFALMCRFGTQLLLYWVTGIPMIFYIFI